jgi:hypothetical protein
MVVSDLSYKNIVVVLVYFIDVQIFDPEISL